MADDIRIGISVVSDSAGTAKARQDLESVNKAIANQKTQFANGNISAQQYNKNLAILEKREKSIKGAIDQTTKEYTKEAAAMKVAAAEARKLAAEKEREARVAAKKPVAGSAEALQQLGRDIRHLPSVNVPGVGIGTDTFGRAAEVAGRLGVSMGQLAAAGGLAIGAVAALAIAIKLMSDAAERQAKVLTAVIDANQKVGEDVAGGLTSENAKKRIEEITRLREREASVLEDSKGALTSAQNQFAQLFYNVNSGADGLSNTVLSLAPQTRDLNAQITEGTANIEAFNTEEAALNKFLEDGTIAANDAAKAEADLAAARTASILTEASQAGDLASLKERATSLTKEQIDSELEAMERREVGMEAELAALEASGDTSEEVAKKIASLKDQLGFLGEQAGVLSAAKPSAKSSEAEKAAEKAAKDRERTEEKAAKDAQKRLEDVAKAQQAYSDKIADAGTAFRDAIADINTSLKDNLFDNAQDLQDSLRESEIDFNQDQLKEERAYQRDLAQIKRDAARDELDATRARDFAALADAREQASDAISERQQEEANENREQLIEFQQHNAELARDRAMADRDSRLDAQRAARDARLDNQRANRDAATDKQRALRDLRGMEQTFQRDSLNSWNGYFRQVSDMQRGAMSASRQSTATGTQASAGSRQSNTTFDDLQVILDSR